MQDMETLSLTFTKGATIVYKIQVDFNTNGRFCPLNHTRDLINYMFDQFGSEFDGIDISNKSVYFPAYMNTVTLRLYKQQDYTTIRIAHTEKDAYTSQQLIKDFVAYWMNLELRTDRIKFSIKHADDDDSDSEAED